MDRSSLHREKSIQPQSKVPPMPDASASLRDPSLEGNIPQEVQLLGHNGEILPQWLQVVSFFTKTTIRVKSPDNTTSLTHRARIAHVRDLGTVNGSETEVKTKEEAEVSDKETTAVAEKPAAKPAKPAAAPKAEKKEKEIPPFDLDNYVSGNGGIHLTKVAKFDHAKYKCTANLVIDEAKGLYYTFNTYTYPNGVISLGKKNTGITKNVLKGHRFTEKGKVKKGKYTSEQLVNLNIKKGYKLISGEYTKDPVKEAKPAAAKAEAKA